VAETYHPPVKHSVEIAGHKTSISLEPLFWALLQQAALVEGLPLNALVARIDVERMSAATPPGLASAIRLWLAVRFAATPEARRIEHGVRPSIAHAGKIGPGTLIIGKGCIAGLGRSGKNSIPDIAEHTQ
jgi:predicted DNA-binding ribbon-helix-helix protein